MADDEINLVEWFNSQDEDKKAVLIKMAAMADSGVGFYNMSRMLLRGQSYNEADLSLLLTYIRAVNGIKVETPPVKKAKKKKKQSEDDDKFRRQSAAPSASKKPRLRSTITSVDTTASARRSRPRTRGHKPQLSSRSGSKKLTAAKKKRAMSVSTVGRKSGSKAVKKKSKLEVLQRSAVSDNVEDSSDDDESDRPSAKKRPKKKVTSPRTVSSPRVRTPPKARKTATAKKTDTKSAKCRRSPAKSKALKRGASAKRIEDTSLAKKSGGTKRSTSAQPSGRRTPKSSSKTVKTPKKKKPQSVGSSMKKTTVAKKKKGTEAETEQTTEETSDRPSIKSGSDTDDEEHFDVGSPVSLPPKSGSGKASKKRFSITVSKPEELGNDSAASGKKTSEDSQSLAPSDSLKAKSLSPESPMPGWGLSGGPAADFPELSLSKLSKQSTEAKTPLDNHRDATDSGDQKKKKKKKRSRRSPTMEPMTRSKSADPPRVRTALSGPRKKKKRGKFGLDPDEDFSLGDWKPPEWTYKPDYSGGIYEEKTAESGTYIAKEARYHEVHLEGPIRLYSPAPDRRKAARSKHTMKPKAIQRRRRPTRFKKKAAARSPAKRVLSKKGAKKKGAKKAKGKKGKGKKKSKRATEISKPETVIDRHTLAKKADFKRKMRAANQARLAAKDEDAIREHVEGLRRQGDVSRLAVYNLNALANLAQNPFNTEYMLELGLLPVLRECLVKQQSEAAFWHEAERWAKQACAQRPRQTPQLVTDCGVLDACVELLQRADLAVGSGQHACALIDAVLDNLQVAATVDCDDTRTALVAKLVHSDDLVATLEQLIAANAKNAELCQAATGTLRRLQVAVKESRLTDIPKALSRVRPGPDGFKQDSVRGLFGAPPAAGCSPPPGGPPVARTEADSMKRWKNMAAALDKYGFTFDEGNSKAQWLAMRQFLEGNGWPHVTDAEWRELEELFKKLGKSQTESWAEMSRFLEKCPLHLYQPLLSAIIGAPANPFLATHACDCLQMTARTGADKLEGIRAGILEQIPERVIAAADGSEEVLPATTVRKKGAEIVSDAMLQNPSFAPLRTEGSLLLDTLVGADELERVLGTLLDWNNESDASLRADVGLLANLELIGKHKRRAIDAGAVAAYMALIDDKMRKGMTRPLSAAELPVVERAVRGLGRLLDDAGAVTLFAKLNGMPQLQYVMKMYGETSEPIYNACNEALARASDTKFGRDVCLMSPIGNELVLKDCVLLMGRHPEYSEAFRDFRQVLTRRGDLEDTTTMGELTESGLFMVVKSALDQGVSEDEDMHKRLLPACDLIRDTALCHALYAAPLTKTNLQMLKKAVEKLKDSPDALAHVLDALSALVAANAKNHELLTAEGVFEALDALKDSDGTAAATRKLIVNFMERIGKVMEDPERGWKHMRQFFTKGAAAADAGADDGFRDARQFLQHPGDGGVLGAADDMWKSMRQFYVNAGDDEVDAALGAELLFDDDYAAAASGDAKVDDGVEDADRRNAVLQFLKDLNDAFEDNPEFAAEFVASQKPKDILDAVQEFFDDPQVVYYGLDDIRHCCLPKDEAAARQLEDIGAVEATGQCMLEHPSDGDVLLAGLQTLARMADYAPGVDAMREAVTQPIINETMQAAVATNVDDADFADAYADYINNLLSDEMVAAEPLQAAQLAQGLAEYGALETLYEAGAKHKAKPEVSAKLQRAKERMEHLLFGKGVDYSDLSKVTAAELALLDSDDLAQVVSEMDNDQLLALLKAARGEPRLTKLAANELNQRLARGGADDDAHCGDALAMLTGRGGLEELLRRAKEALADENAGVEAAILDTVGLLSRDARMRSLLAMHGLIPLILKIMRANPKDILLLDKCCFILANLAVSNDTNVSEIIECGGVHDLVAVIKRHGSVSFLCESALNVLVNCCHGSERNKQIIAHSEGGKASLAVISKFVPKTKAAVEKVAMAGASGDAHALAAARRAVAKKTEKDPCVAAFRLLSNLAIVEDNVAVLWKQKTVPQIMKYGKDGGVDCDSQQISHMAVVCLANMSSHVVAAPHMCHLGALRFLLQVSQHWEGDLEIQKSCIGCLGNLLTNAPGFISQFLEIKGAQRVFQIMESLIFETEIICLCFQLLKIACNSPSMAIRVARSGGTQACIDAINEHINASGEIVSKQIAIYGCQALAKMITSREVCHTVLGQNIIGMLEKVVKGHDYWRELSLMAEAIKVCANFSSIEENATAMTKKLGVSILKSVELHSTNGVFLSNVALTLAKSSMFRSCARHLVKRGCVAVIVKSATLNPDRRDVIERYLKTLANFVFVESRAYSECVRTGAVDIFQTMIHTYHAGYPPIKGEFDAFQRAMKLADSGTMLPPPPGSGLGPRGSVSLARSRSSVSMARRKSSTVKDMVHVSFRRALQAGTLVHVHKGGRKAKSKVVRLTEDMLRLQMYNSFDDILEGKKAKHVMPTEYMAEVVDGNLHPHFMVLQPSALHCCVLKGMVPGGKAFDTCLEFKSPETQQKWVSGLRAIISEGKKLKASVAGSQMALIPA